MDWISVNDKLPIKYEEVIVCSRDGVVKSAVYLDNSKWTTYLPVTHWMSYPEPPDKFSNDEQPAIEPVKKKRGRPKKNG